MLVKTAFFDLPGMRKLGKNKIFTFASIAKLAFVAYTLFITPLEDKITLDPPFNIV